jgi:hypothetical protein
VPIAAVVVLSPEFVRKKYTMLELKMFLERKAKDPDSIVIIPVFLGLTVEQCYNLEQLYDSEPWPTSPSMPTVEKAVLQGWAADVKQILISTGVKIEEVSVTCDGYKCWLHTGNKVRSVLLSEWCHHVCGHSCHSARTVQHQ